MGLRMRVRDWWHWRRYGALRRDFVVEGMTMEDGAQWLLQLAQALHEQTGAEIQFVDLNGAPAQQEPDPPTECDRK